MKMNIKVLNNRGMTLVEILVALALFAMLTMIFAPFFAQQYSLLVQAGELNEKAIENAHELERGLAEVRVTPDTRHVPIKYLNEAYQKNPVRGWLITEGEYSTFVSYDAFISNGPFALSEGYGPKTKDGKAEGDTHYILIRGNDTHFKSSATQFKVKDKDGMIVVGAGTFADIESSSVAYIKIRTTGEGVLTAAGSPYTIEITTPDVYEELDGALQDEVMHAQLFVGLPFYLVGGNSGNVYTSSDPSYWVGDSSFPSSTVNLYASLYCNGMFLIGGQNGAIYYRTGDQAWTLCSTPGISKTVRDMAYDVENSIYVAVGDGGMIARSTNGIVWTLVSSGTANNLTGIAYGNGTFIAIGQCGVTLRSTDGLSWAAGSANYGNDLNDITFKYNKFIAVGKYIKAANQYNYTSYLWYTDDGASWTSVVVLNEYLKKNDIPITFESVGWDDSYFIIGQSNGRFRYSADLKSREWWFLTFSWSETSSTGVTTPIRDIAWLDGVFLAVTDNGMLLYSSTGISGWNVKTLGSQNLYTICTW
ncbi:MAG TPA: hypothetical protein DDZ89_09695 [Clostridiales bacterium]|nr:hypothetical protein [Clostridiales bacterium]